MAAAVWHVSGSIQRAADAVATGRSGCGPGAGLRPGNCGECGLWQFTQSLAVDRAQGSGPNSRWCVRARRPPNRDRSGRGNCRTAAGCWKTSPSRPSRVCSSVEIGFVVAVEAVVVAVMAAVVHHDVRMFLGDDQVAGSCRTAAAAACPFRDRRSNRNRTGLRRRVTRSG